MRTYAHFKTYQKVISMLLVVCFLVTPLTFFSLPRKAEATCVPFNNPLLPAPTSVGTHLDPASASNQANQTMLGTTWFKTCILDGLATMIAKTIIKSLTKSIVRWINSGFKGNPSFVQNTDKFMGRVADKVAGNMIERIAPFLCSPFRLNIELALALSMTSPGDEISCTLTDVENNFRDFLGNSGVRANLSWDNWYDITQNPQNNPYGAMMIAQGRMNTSIETAQGKYQQQLDWGRGFLSFEECSEDVLKNYTYSADPNDKQVYDDKAQPVYGVQAGNNNCVTKTPGAVIESQLENTLGSDLRGLEIAQSIDQIVAALVGQLVTQAIGGIGGLMGANVNNSYSGGDGGYDYSDIINRASGGSTIPDLPITGSCMPNTQNAKIGDVVVWDAYVPDINGNTTYIWYGDNNLQGNDSFATTSYTTNGLKGASVIVSTDSQSVQINCTPSVEVGNTSTNSYAPTIYCVVSPNTVSLSTPTAVTWQAVAVGGIAPFTYYWEGTDGLASAGQNVVKSYTTTGTKTATLSVVDAEGTTYIQACDGTVNVTQ